MNIPLIQAQYFTTGKVDKDPVANYANKGWTQEEAEWWLVPVLGY